MACKSCFTFTNFLAISLCFAFASVANAQASQEAALRQKAIQQLSLDGKIAHMTRQYGAESARNWAETLIRQRVDQLRRQLPVAQTTTVVTAQATKQLPAHAISPPKSRNQSHTAQHQFIAKSPIRNKDLVSKAYATKEEFSELQKTIDDTEDALLADLSTAIKTIRSFDIGGERQSLSALRNVSKSFLNDVNELVDTYDKFVSATNKYAKLVGDSSPYFKASAAAFREAAASEKYDDIHLQYELLAEVFDRLEKKMRDRATAIEPVIERIDEAMDYVKHTQTFLERLDAILAPLPDDAVSIDVLLEQLSAYKKKFEALQAVLKQFHSAMHVDQIST